ncbi:putative phosphoprotein [Bole Tick Virus 2]|uniref:Putative phosphoprotein n=1 Tax=Bole Tick Virus 2 TaxID=1608041 RepID=A0A0B5KET3_9RHAB|nr:putative phosphoprotein [Bole Tick Virus 2]AJG39099.1 putative phosphoprotein [Bole Tick Virus 2]
MDPTLQSEALSSSPSITHDHVRATDFSRSFVSPEQINALVHITNSMRETIMEEVEGPGVQEFFNETLLEEHISGYHYPSGSTLEPAPLPPGTRVVELTVDKTEEVNNYVFEKIKELMTKLAAENIITPAAPSMVGQIIQIPLNVVPHFKTSSSRSVNTDVSSSSKDPGPDKVSDPGIHQVIKDLMEPAGIPSLSGQRMRVMLSKCGVGIEAVSRAVLRERSYYLDPQVSRERKIYNLLGLTQAGAKIRRMLTAPP